MSEGQSGTGPRLGVLGAGTMGRGIVQVAAIGGCEVKLYDSSADAADAGVRVRAVVPLLDDAGVALAVAVDAALARRGNGDRRVTVGGLVFLAQHFHALHVDQRAEKHQAENGDDELLESEGHGGFGSVAEVCA